MTYSIGEIICYSILGLIVVVLFIGGCLACENPNKGKDDLENQIND